MDIGMVILNFQFAICNLYIGYFSKNDSKITLKTFPVLIMNDLCSSSAIMIMFETMRLKLTRPYTQGCLLGKVILALVK